MKQISISLLVNKEQRTLFNFTNVISMKIVFELELLKLDRNQKKIMLKSHLIFCGDQFKNCLLYILFPFEHDEEFFLVKDTKNVENILL